MNTDSKELDFGSYEEAGEWFDTHDLADFEDRMHPVDFQFDLRRNRDWVELEREIATGVRKLAKETRMPTRRLVNELIREGIENLR